MVQGEGREEGRETSGRKIKRSVLVWSMGSLHMKNSLKIITN